MKSRLTQLPYAVLLFLVFLSSAHSASAQIRMRGITTTLDQSSDRFLALDLNGDGKSDLLYFRPGGGYADAFLSHGDGTFRQVEYVAGGSRYNGFVGDLSDSRDAFAIGDFNGDGKSDFIGYRPGSGDSYLCLSVGDGSVKCDTLSSTSGPQNGFNDRMTGGNERIVTMDLNGDGKSDLIVYAPGSGYAHAYLSKGDGTVTAVNLNGFIQNDLNAQDAVIVPLDVDHDGRADLLVSAPQSSGGVLRLYLNHANSVFTRFDLSDGTADHDGFHDKASDPNAHLIALDLDGDGNTDFLWWQAGSSVLTGYTSRGDGTFNYLPYQSSNGNAPGFVGRTSSTADTAVAVNLHGSPGFLWYTPGQGNVVAYQTSASDALTAQPLVTGGNRASGFGDTDMSSNSTALAVNFRGYSDSGAFFWYAPGNSGLLQAYESMNGPNFDLNTYSFTAYPSTFLSDLNWSIGNVPLKEIVMPGTHDSAMYNLNLGHSDVSETQWGDISDQLANGARYFDFRMGQFTGGTETWVGADGTLMLVDTGAPTADETLTTTEIAGLPNDVDDLMYGHGYILTNYAVKDVLNTMEDWLDEDSHLNEVIILDVTNNKLAGTTLGNALLQDEVINGTHHPDLIYTQLTACGSSHCGNRSVFPQNLSVNQLKHLGYGSKGARLIITAHIDGGPGPVQNSGLGWLTIDKQVGYCGGGGVTHASDEIDCIKNGDSSTPPLSLARPNYQAADADPNFSHVVAALTPSASGLTSPVYLADGTAGGTGFNNGNDPNDLDVQLQNGAWATNALNLFSIDGLGGDNVPQLLIQRNKQTWRNAGFYNNKFAQPAGAISAAPNGDVWAAGAHSTSLFHYNATNGIWTDVVNFEPNVKKLAADAKGGVWVIEDGQGTAGPLVYYDANGHKTTTGSVDEDVAVGADGSVWAIGEVGNLFNYQAGPTVQPSSVPTQTGAHLAVDNRGYPWVVQSNGTIQRFTGSGWAQVTNAKGKEIAISAEGSVFITGFSQPSVGRLNRDGSGFDFFLMDANHITVDGTGHPWAIRQVTGAVYKGALDQM